MTNMSDLPKSQGLPKLPPGRPTFFVITWGPAECEINGPFGDDSEAALNYARNMLLEGAEQAGVFILHLHEVRLEDKPKDYGYAGDEEYQE
jgi:hypothetical protein